MVARAAGSTGGQMSMTEGTQSAETFTALEEEATGFPKLPASMILSSVRLCELRLSQSLAALFIWAKPRKPDMCLPQTGQTLQVSK